MYKNLIDILEFTVLTVASQPITIGDILLIPLLFAMGLFTTRLLLNAVSKRLISRKTDPNLIHLIQRIIYIVVISVLVITTLDLVNIPLTAFAFLSGAVAIGVGFGAQNIINNFISGWILMWERPIRIGDFLEIDGTKGTVEKINTRSTQFKRVDGVHLLIPNSKLLENTIINWTLVDKLVRTPVRIGVAYGSPVQQVSNLIMQAAKAQPEVLEYPAPVVLFDDFGDNALIFELNVWINSDAEAGLRQIRSNIRFDIDKRFAEHNITIAFPQRDVHLDGTINLIQQGA